MNNQCLYTNRESRANDVNDAMDAAKTDTASFHAKCTSTVNNNRSAVASKHECRQY